MDSKEKLIELYDSIFEILDPYNFLKVALANIEDLEAFNTFLEATQNKFEGYYNDYLGLINSNEMKHIALTRLKVEFQLYFDETMRLFDWRKPFDRKIFEVELSHDKLKIKSPNWTKICIDVNDLFFLLIFEFVNVDLLDLEFELIGATPPPRKTKPTKETKLALTQNELMYLFMKLSNENLFTSSDKIHLARGIEYLSQFSANKTREKGQNLSLKEVENIKKVIDNISTSLQNDIEHGGVK